MTHPLENLFKPRSVAIIGASRSAGKHGNRPIGYLKRAGFAGELVDQPEAGVVARRGVFRPGIAEADDELDHGANGFGGGHARRWAAAQQGSIREKKPPDEPAVFLATRVDTTAPPVSPGML